MVVLLLVYSYMYIMHVCLFFFQAEDGIRYLVRSRGLGDVYKRQNLSCTSSAGTPAGPPGRGGEDPLQGHLFERSYGAVSYTHLTLPTSDLV